MTLTAEKADRVARIGINTEVAIKSKRVNRSYTDVPIQTASGKLGGTMRVFHDCLPPNVNPANIGAMNLCE